MTHYGQAAFEAFARISGTEEGRGWDKQPTKQKTLWEGIAQAVLDAQTPEQDNGYVAVIERPWIPKVLIHGEEMEVLHPLQMSPEQRTRIDKFGQTYAVLRETPADQITDEITQKAYADCGTMLQIFVPKLSAGHLKLMDLTDRYSLIHGCFIAYDRILAERTNRVEAATE